MLNNVIDSQTLTHNRDIRKVSKRQHQYPQFGHTHGEIKKKPEKKYISIQLGVKLRKPSILMVPEFHLSFFFPKHLHCCYIIPLEPCALNAEIQHFVLSFSISY